VTITGKTEKLELNTLRFENLKGIESRCQESLTDFKEGDKIVVISLGEFKNNGIELNDGIYFVKVESCKDFLSRYVDTIQKEIVKPSQND